MKGRRKGRKRRREGGRKEFANSFTHVFFFPALSYEITIIG